MSQLDSLLHELFDDKPERIVQQQVPQIPGLTFIPQFFKQHEQDLLLQRIAESKWFETNQLSSSSSSDTGGSSSGHGSSSSSSNHGMQPCAVPPVCKGHISSQSDSHQQQSIGSEYQQQQPPLCSGPDHSSSSSGRGNGSSSSLNQVMLFGVNNMPPWLQQLGQQLPLQDNWPEQLASRRPVFDTAIINLYNPGDGISDHVDLIRFSDGIVIISLGDPAIMNFTPAAAAAVVAGNAQCTGTVMHCSSSNSQQQQQQQQRISHQLLLQGGDVVLLHGEARYCWYHGIAAVQQEVLHCSKCTAAAAAKGCIGGALGSNSNPVAAAVTADKPEGRGCEDCRSIVRGRRISITLRQLDPNQAVLDMQ